MKFATLAVVFAVASSGAGAAAFAPHHGTSSTGYSSRSSGVSMASLEETETKATETTTEEAAPSSPSSSAASSSPATASAAASPPPPADVAAYSNGYKTVFTEQPCDVRTSSSASGLLPPDLKGTLFRSGPAMFSAGSLPPPPTSLVKPKSPPVPDGQDMGRMVAHPFEGDGAVLGLTLPGDGTAVMRYRYVRTNAFTNERKKGSKMYDAMESTRSSGPALGGGQANDQPVPAYRHHLAPGLNRKRKNTSNTRALYWSKKLLTLWEGGLPYKLDALALSTEGRSQLGGVLKEADPFGAGVAYDPSKRRILMYSCVPDSGRSDLRIYEFNAKFRLVPDGNGGITETELDGYALISDIVATENYAVVVQPEVGVNGMSFLMNKEPGRCLDLKGGEGKATLHLIPRVSSSKSQTISVPIPADGLSNADVQFCNAYESSDGGTVVIDAIRSDPSMVKGNGKPLSWPWATTTEEYASTASKKSLWRYTVNVAGGGGSSVKVERIGAEGVQAQFGTINPEYSAREHRYVYAAVGQSETKGASPPRGIGKFDVQQGTTETWIPKEAHQFCGEPIYAPRADGGEGEDDGYILTVMYDGKTDESSLVVLDASNIAKGPVSVVSLGMAVPHGLYGCFASSDEAVWDAEEVRRRAKLADKMEGRGSMWNEVKSDFSGLGLRLDDLEEYFGDVI